MVTQIDTHILMTQRKVNLWEWPKLHMSTIKQYESLLLKNKIFLFSLPWLIDCSHNNNNTATIATTTKNPVSGLPLEKLSKNHT